MYTETKDNIRYIAAHLHIQQAANIFKETNQEIAKTLQQLSDWIIQNYSLTQEQMDFFRKKLEYVSKK